MRFVHGLVGQASLSLIPTSIPVMDPEDRASVKSASPGLVAPSAGMKRKRAPEPKFYAVRVGVKPGIYSTWKECLQQVKGFKNATCEHLLHIPLVFGLTILL